jgi:glycosyltransferase involved in cell wall biosynthesis
VLTIVVMPCLNEVDHVTEAIASLLRVPDATGADTQLVVVDNGSTDGTLPLLHRLRERHPRNLHIAHEDVRGYVPPRHRGVTAAAEIAAAGAHAAEDTLILQADADTIYREGYVAAMVAAARDRPGTFLEGATRRPPAFEADHPEFVEAERAVDAAIEHLEAPDELDVVVDDKVCGYRLSDYMRWGGLFEETTASGDQIHAETTRLFIRARLAHGAQKVRVNPAGASPSRRRFLEQPRLQFATLGFPRERTWSETRPELRDRAAIDAFAREVLRGGERDAVWLRSAHLIALFRFLPAMVSRAEAGGGATSSSSGVAHVVPRSRGELATRPGLALCDAFGLISERPDLFPPSQ